MFDKSDKGEWISEEAVVDNGAVERRQSHDEEKRGHAHEEMRSRKKAKYRQLAHRFWAPRSEVYSKSDQYREH